MSTQTSEGTMGGQNQTSEARHTPGPWRYFPAQNYDGFAIAPRHRLLTLAAVERKGSITCFNYPEQTEPNARLIAAAPDLLEALKSLIPYCEHLAGENFHCEVLRGARDVIAKAEGR